MPDPIDELQNFDPGAPMTPLPPSEVRRLGDRHRRRRTAGVALAAAAAVAVVATGGAVLGGGEPRTLDPADDPSPSVPTPTPSASLIPGDLDLTAGMSENESGEPVTQTATNEGVGTIEVCGAPSFPLDAVVERVAANASGPEYGQARELRVYPDEAAAAAAVDGVRQAVRSCPTEQFTTTTWIREVLPSELGENATVTTLTYEDSGRPALGATWWHVVQVGRAVLATTTGGEYGNDLTAVVAEEATELEPIIDEQLCGFSDEGCAGDPAPTEASTAAPPATNTDDIPAGFPLAAGWPERHEPGPGNGLTGPAPEVAVVEDLEACDTPLPGPPALDRLGAAWANVEDYRYRQLLTFDDADAAIAYQGQLVEAYRACPRTEEDADGYATVHDVRRTQVGGESWAVVKSWEFQGSPAIGLEVVHVVRLGRALLIDTTSSEAMPSAAQDKIAEQTEASAEVLSAMCAFTEAGC